MAARSVAAVVLLAALAVLPTACAAPAAVDEAAVMQRLRAAVVAAGGSRGHFWAGWDLGEEAPHCLWRGVDCDQRGNVVRITWQGDFAEGSAGAATAGQGAASRAAGAGPAASQRVQAGGGNATLPTMPPELAQLQWLQELHLSDNSNPALRQPTPLFQGLPAEWGLPGAFPRLTIMRLLFDCLAAPPLPQVQPGALPRLQDLIIQLPAQPELVALPPNWGASPRTLPALRRLTLEAPVALPLPAAWARGFRQLAELTILGTTAGQEPASTVPPSAAEAPAAAAPGGAVIQDARAQPRGPLPEAWARGFPLLTSLTLRRMGLTGSIPAAWQAPGNFPALAQLSLDTNYLSGRLPAKLFSSSLPSLRRVELSYNQLTGPLPDSWADSQRALSLFLGHNRLSGPAFPPAWLSATATMDAEILSLEGNARLGGTLPSQLPWRSLKQIDLSYTAVEGRIPEAWCQAPFADLMTLLVVHHTAVPPELPACAARDMPLLRLTELAAWRDPPPSGLEAGALPASSTALDADLGGRNGRATLLVALLSAAAGAVAATAGGLVMRRVRRRRAHAYQRQLDEPQQPQHREQGQGARPRQRQGEAVTSGGLQGLLRRVHAQAQEQQRQQQQGGTDQEPGDGEATMLLGPGRGGASLQLVRQRRRPAPAAELAPGRARLKAMVQQQVASRPQGTEVLPPGQLMQALVHQLAPGGPAAAAASGAPPAKQAGTELQQWLADGSRGNSGRQTAGRRWGLESESLRLDASALQFVAEPDGRLVQLGEGAAAVVYLAKLAGVYVAVKVFELQPGVLSGVIWHEISLLRACSHPQIVPVYGVALQGQLLMVAMQLMLGGSLRAAVLDPDRHEELSWGARGRQVALDVAEALAHLHTQTSILHSDVKSANVLLSTDWRAHLSDMGVAQALGPLSARTAAGGSALYAAPEQLLGKRCTLAADVYSLGLLLVELCTRHVISRRGDWRLPTAPEDCPQEVADLIRECVEADPAVRPTAVQAAQRLRQSSAAAAAAAAVESPC